MVLLGNDITFPDPRQSDADGLVALGGDLHPERLLTAYKNGIFPWETDPVIAWYSPDPRCVLLPQHIVVSKSMRSILKSGRFSFKMNTCFEQVIHYCKNTIRKGVKGSWISDDLINSFITLHKRGLAICGETWHDEKLVGGLYGLKIGKVFFGESMFSHEDNASKFALIKLVDHLKNDFDVALIDCQVYSEHLESMGAVLINRNEFLKSLKLLIE